MFSFSLFLCPFADFYERSFAYFAGNIFVLFAGSDADENDTDAARLMSLPVLLQRSVMAPLLTQ